MQTDRYCIQGADVKTSNPRRKWFEMPAPCFPGQMKNAHDIIAAVAAKNLTDPLFGLPALNLDPRSLHDRHIAQAIGCAIRASNWRAKLTADDVANGLPLENVDHGYLTALIDFKIVLVHQVLAVLGEVAEPQM